MGVDIVVVSRDRITRIVIRIFLQLNVGCQYDRCQGYDCENCYSDIITTECSENDHDVRDINMMHRHY